MSATAASIPPEPPRRQCRTIEEALQVCAQRIASPRFAELARQQAGGVFDQTYLIQIKHHKDGFIVILEFRHRTPARTLLVIQDLM